MTEPEDDLVERALMGGFPTPEDAAVSGFAAHVAPTVVQATADDDRAQVTVRTNDGPDVVVCCIHRQDGWYDVADVGA